MDRIARHAEPRGDRGCVEIALVAQRQENARVLGQPRATVGERRAHLLGRRGRNGARALGRGFGHDFGVGLHGAGAAALPVVREDAQRPPFQESSDLSRNLLRAAQVNEERADRFLDQIFHVVRRNPPQGEFASRDGARELREFVARTQIATACRFPRARRRRGGLHSTTSIRHSRDGYHERMILAGILCAFSAAEEPTPIRVVEEFSIDVSGGEFDVVRRASGGGLLRAWVESDAFDARLVAEDESGMRIAEDDDSGGRPSPWIDVPCAAGRSVRFVVGAKNGTGAGRLVILETAESAAALADADRARAELDRAVLGLGTDAVIEHRSSLAELGRRIGDHPDLSTSEAVQSVLFDIAQALDRAGDHPAALAAAQLVVAAQRDRSPPESKPALRARLLACTLMGQVGRAAEAIPEMRAAVAACQRTLESTDRGLASAEAGLGILLAGIGDMAGAMEIWEIVAARLERIEPVVERDRTQMQANLAVGAFYLGDLPRARRHAEAAREGASSLLLGSALDLQIRTAYGSIVTEQGDHATGRVLAEETLASARASYPPGHVAVAMAELNVALAQVRAGEDQTARTVMQRILAEPPAGIAPDHQIFVQTRFNLAAVNLRLGAVVEAERELARLMEQFMGELSGTHALLRGILRNRALALRTLGRYDETAQVEAELLPMVRESLPPDHIDRLQVELQCAETDGQRLRSTEARQAVDAVAQDLLAMLAARALILSPHEAEASARSSRMIVDNVQTLLLDPSLSAVHAGGTALAFEVGETARAMGIAAARSLRATQAGGVEVVNLRESARRAQVDVVRAARASASQSLREALERRDVAQRALRTHLAARSAVPRAISVAALADGLAPDEAAVSWRVRTRGCDDHEFDTATEESLLGFVVRPDATVDWVDLGQVDEIAVACRAWRAELVSVPFDPAALRAAGERVRRLVVDPLRALIPDARRWRVATDGPLFTVPLDALPDPGERGDELLGDHLRLVTVWSFETETETTRAREKGEGVLVLVGDPDFGTPADGSAPRWSSLTATGGEIESVAQIRRTAAGEGAVVELLRGTEASARRLTERAGVARWLHVATHGAFDEDDAPGSLLTAGSDELAAEHGRSLRALVPMVRCELVLAGANVDRDATLTAEELGALDLSGCELAVLSACDTARGEVIAGQGAASFQRGLLGAGARASVTALWRVPDEATRELMTHFYRGVWRDGLAPDVALWRAKCALRERRAPPRSWAAWVLSTSFSE